MPVYTKLYFSGVVVSKNPFYIKPVFKCPNCGAKFNPQYQPTANLPANFDFNKLVTFTCTNCASTFRIYVAIHNDPANGLVWLIKDSTEGVGIDADWRTKYKIGKGI